MAIEQPMEMKRISIRKTLGFGHRAARLLAGSALIVPLVVAVTEISSWMTVGLPYVMAAACYLLLTGIAG